MKHSIAIYRIRIYPNRNPKDLEILSEISTQNYDLHTLLDTVFKKLMRNSTNPKPIVDNKLLKKLLRIKHEIRDNGNIPVYYSGGRLISGILQSGAYGYEEDIVDTSGNNNYRKSKSEAQMKPFFFLIEIPKDETTAYLFIQRNSSDGIFQVLSEMIIAHLKDSLGEDYTINIEPFSISDLRNLNYGQITEAKSITLQQPKDKFVSPSFLSNFIHEDDLYQTVTIKAKRGKSFDFSSFVNEIRQKYLINKNESPEDMPEEIDGYDTSKISVTVEMSGVEKTFKLNKISSLGSVMYIDDKIEKDSDGYPSYAAMKKETDILRGYIDKNKHHGQ